MKFIIAAAVQGFLHTGHFIDPRKVAVEHKGFRQATEVFCGLTFLFFVEPTFLTEFRRFLLLLWAAGTI